MARAAQHPADIIIFDGLCTLCSANAQFVLRHDADQHFTLVAIQSARGAAFCVESGIDPADPDTLIVVTPAAVLRNSDAVLHIYRHLGWPWRIAGGLRIIPRALRDPLYRLIARNRYRWFGRRETCWAPSAGERSRLQ